MKRLCLILLLGLFYPSAIPQNKTESSELPVGSELRVMFDQPVEATSAKAGDSVRATVIGLVSGSRIKRPRQPLTLFGHVTEVKARADDQRESRVGIAFDKIVIGSLTDQRREIALNAVITRIVKEEWSAVEIARVPTSGDDSVQRAAGPVVDSNGQPVYPSRPPASQPGPAGRRGLYDRPVKELTLHRDEAASVTFIACHKRDVVLDPEMYVIVKVTRSGK